MRELLADLLTEEVSIVTDMHSAVMTEGGDLAEVPFMVEGMFVDYDDKYLLIASNEHSPPELVNRDRVVSIKVVDKLDEIMSDPSKPSKGSLN